MKSVLVFGTFDILHPGHVKFLRRAKKYGDTLYVVVARDSTVKDIKSRKPHNSEFERFNKIEAIKEVDIALLGHKRYKYAVLSKIRPDIICLGYDQEYLTNELPAELAKRNLKTKIIRLKPFKEHKYKSSKLRP